MDNELVNSSLPVDNREGMHNPLYSDIFYEQFPMYLAIGMTEEQYWDKDCDLVNYYRKADEIRRIRQNQNLWLQGAYIYDAIIRIAPALQAFPNKKSKVKPYIEEPFPITEQMQKDEIEKREKTKSQKGLAYMQQFIAQSKERK